MWGLGASSGLTPASAYCASEVAIPVILQSRFHEHAGIFGFQGAVVNLTRGMGLQYAKLGITANALCPGFHITGMINDETQGQQGFAAMAVYTPISLASSAPDFMTWQTLVTEGGCLAGPGVHGGKT
ncbi:hypothetical protein FIBSPDRAFT_903244 [Athelia psychrophila]|uniref:NAD(P)-binding protein n=1 Tax=Athelia psychrophila TaxID=1759441 RepID=A0A167W8D6_9AGAM|nr:hypothetical protein FIBSPDRAFT_903244 [Fibularhizoctonia sp. CBS 109695]